MIAVGPGCAQQDEQAPVAMPSMTPIAIVSIDSSATVTGALQVTAGKAMIATTGTVTSTDKTTDVVLPHRGMLHVCASTTVKLTADASVPAGETPGLMMALDHGALETSFATGRNSDILLTPDFRILLGGPGASEVKVRLGPHGDTCIDNPGANAPYVLVTGIFDGGAYRVEPGQRVMFQHGSLHDVVDQEKEPCGCPATPRPGSNDFPLAESAGLAPLAKAAASPKPPANAQKLPPEVTAPLVYQAGPLALGPEQKPEAASTAQTASATTPQPPQKHRNILRRIGGFFRRIFGAE